MGDNIDTMCLTPYLNRAYHSAISKNTENSSKLRKRILNRKPDILFNSAGKYLYVYERHVNGTYTCTRYLNKYSDNPYRHFMRFELEESYDKIYFINEVCDEIIGEERYGTYGDVYFYHVDRKSQISLHYAHSGQMHLLCYGI